MRRAALRLRFGRSALKSVHWTDLPLARTCLTAQKVVSLHEVMPKLAPFLKDFLHTAK